MNPIPTPLIPVVLCGGAGTRLWPLSREAEPKQFLSLMGGQETLLQATISRLDGLQARIPTVRVSESPIFVTQNDTRFLVAGQLQAMGVSRPRILLEPQGKNTAPALTIAALQAISAPDINDPVLLAMPADHVVLDQPAFVAAVAKALPAAAGGSVVTFGIVPDRAETGYGYIEVNACFAAEGEPRPIASFVEKPNLLAAQEYASSGRHFWNSGLFMMRASVWLRAVERLRPDILTVCRSAMNQAHQDLDFIRPDSTVFSTCPSESIDYAVMEHLPGNTSLCIDTLVMPLKAGWSDVGAWDALRHVMDKDADGNARVGHTLLHNAKDSLVFASHRTVALAGLEQVGVVETADAVLVVNLQNTQDVKHIVSQLKAREHPIAFTHRKVPRPWGWYDSLDSGERFQVKRISVNPGASLSLQLHHHRAEHWVVVKGTAEVVNGDRVLVLQENQSTYIPVGQKHRLTNRGTEPLEIIEVQSGNYLGEDDIVRFEDTFGRVA